MNLQGVMELGYMCGLHTLREALNQALSHWNAFPPGAFEELHAELSVAPDYDIGVDMLCVHFLGAERCAQMDAELEAYFTESMERSEASANTFEEFSP